MTTNGTNNIQAARHLGQSLWYDNISREMLQSGALQRFIDEGLLGMTSNPAIFEKAIAHSSAYDAQLQALALATRQQPFSPFQTATPRGTQAASGAVKGASASVANPTPGNAKDLYEAMAIADIRQALDLFLPVFERSHRQDGYVSLEVSPYLADDTEATIAEGKRLFAEVGRPNLMIKVPGTRAGVPAIKALIAAGINVNVTLLFSIDAYVAAAEAYLAGLEEHMAAGGDLGKVTSVASFFLSRIDSLVDERLAKDSPLRGKVAIAGAKLAYVKYQALIASERWQKLQAKGATPQRLLWASTSTKNPAYSPTLYVDELIGPDTVNTVPAETYELFKTRGTAALTLSRDVAAAEATMAALPGAGVALTAVTDQLLKEAIEKFAQPFTKLLEAAETKRQKFVAEGQNAQTFALGTHSAAVAAQVKAWSNSAALPVQQLWNKDPSLFTKSGENEWLGWLGIVAEQQRHLGELQQLAERGKAFRHVVVLGMGGSSLCPWVFAQTFASASGFAKLLVLDSTAPVQIAAVEAQLSLRDTLFIVSSKSGGTTEPNVLMAYFAKRLEDAGVAKVGQHFIAITDPGSSLQKIAEERQFAAIFAGEKTIGGRYSALSNFGLVPLALMGVDVGAFLARTQLMVLACSAFSPAEVNPGVLLGLTLGVLAKNGRDKVTFIAAPKVASLGAWFEQLIAESTGKLGKGIVPVAGEPLGSLQSYGKDRVFVFLSDGPLGKELAERATEFEQADHPVIRLRIEGEGMGLGQEFFRWQVATAVAGAVLGINPFDQPDVEAAKIATKKLIAEGPSAHPEKPALSTPAFDFFLPSVTSTPAATGAAPTTAAAEAEVKKFLQEFFARCQPNDYIAINAFLAMTEETETELTLLRTHLRNRYRAATTLGFGPRFLHSTGQLHKGGANNGVFLELGEAPSANDFDLPIPGLPYTFAALKNAQLGGDDTVLRQRGRRAVRVILKEKNALAQLRRLVETL